MNKQLLQPLTKQILTDVRQLITSARYAALSVAEASTGHPAISRVALTTLPDITPILLTSELAPHTAALRADSRCSLLIGEVGKGDPMAHPRVTLFCMANASHKDVRAQLRNRFLTHHPKSKNYIDLPDFGFWRLDIIKASFNAGFGKAYAISTSEIIL